MNFMNTFFKNLEKKDKYLSFLIYRVLYDPKLIFDQKLRKEDKRLYREGIKPYILNNYFLYFLDIVLTSHEFNKKLDYNTTCLILEMLQKSEEFYKTTNKKLSNIFTLKKEKPKNFSFLYKNLTNFYNYDDYDLSVSKKVIENLKNIKEFKYVIEILPKEREKGVINRILNDNYGVEESCFLNNHSYDDAIITSTIVCNNKFLFLVDELLNYKLGIDTLKSMLNILNFSVNIKLNRINDEELSRSYIRTIGREKYESFDPNYAIELIDEIKEFILEEKRLNKVINFPKAY